MLFTKENWIFMKNWKLNAFIFLVFVIVLFVYAIINIGLGRGIHERIYALTDVNLKGKNNEALYLGHLVKTHDLYLWNNVSDEGYVLGVSNTVDRYYPLPVPEVVAKMQQADLLPKKFPEYRLSISDYVMGYFFYLLVAVLSLYSYIKNELKQRKKLR